MYYLLTAGSGEHEVLQTGSIYEAIPPSCQTIYSSSTFKCINSEYIWVVKIKYYKLLRGSTQAK